MGLLDLLKNYFGGEILFDANCLIMLINDLIDLIIKDKNKDDDLFGKTRYPSKEVQKAWTHLLTLVRKNCKPNFAAHVAEFVDNLTLLRQEYRQLESSSIPKNKHAAVLMNKKITELKNNWDGRWKSECNGTELFQYHQSSYLERLPKYLVIAFKRTDINGQRINYQVDYPLDNLDIKELINPISKSTMYHKSTKYRLNSVVVHLDNPPHYVAYLRHDQKWLNISDSQITEIDQSEIRDKHDYVSYILIYQQM
jgi:hypothetical protein